MYDKYGLSLKQIKIVLMTASILLLGSLIYFVGFFLNTFIFAFIIIKFVYLKPQQTQVYPFYATMCLIKGNSAINTSNRVINVIFL